MKHPRSIASQVGLAVLLCACAPASEEPAAAGGEETAVAREDVVAAIDMVRDTEMSTLLTGQVDAMDAAFTADVVWMPPNAPVLEGREAVMDWMTAMADAYEVDVRYTGSDVTLAGDWAIERYLADLTLTPRGGGESMASKLKGIHVYQRQPDGRWLMAQDIWNETNPAGGE